jgi:hypothetical protein
MDGQVLMRVVAADAGFHALIRPSQPPPVLRTA